MAVEDSQVSTPLPEEIEQSPVAPRSGALSIDQLIERWWQDHFPGSAIARDTQAGMSPMPPRNYLSGF